MSELRQMVNDYIELPLGVLIIRDVKFGRFTIKMVIMDGREAALTFRESILDFFERPNPRPGFENGIRCPPSIPVGTPARSLSVEIQDHLKSLDRRGLESTTIATRSMALQGLLWVCGDINAADVNRSHIHAVCELFRWVSSKTIRDPVARKTSFSRFVAQGKKTGINQLSSSTLEGRRYAMVAFFNDLLRTRAIDCSPMEGFRPTKKDFAIDLKCPRRAFTEEELQKIFDPKSFSAWAVFPHRWWVPMIALYTGVKINEIAQMRVEDVRQEQDDWVFDFRKKRDQNPASDRSRFRRDDVSRSRSLPIPPALIEAGFLDFWNDMKTLGHERLFSLLPPGKQRLVHYDSTMGIDFGLYLQRLGFPGGVGFRALHLTFVETLHVEGVSDQNIALVTGMKEVFKCRPSNLRKHYFHPSFTTARNQQKETLKLFQPNLNLPRYVPKQFSHVFSGRRRRVHC